MTFLLDAHSLIWYTAGNDLLTPAAVSLIDARPQECAVSIATVWEIGIKHSIGKLQLGMPFAEFLDAAIADNGFALYPISPAHVVAVSRLPFHHRDPFDRMLVAQSQADGLQIISRDAQLDAYGVKRIW